jgi:hypothetical protein
MTEHLGGRDMLLLWTGVLLGPIAWSISLVALFWLTHPVCQGARHGLLWVTGGVCAVIGGVTLLGAWIALRRIGHARESTGIAPFMVRMALAVSAIFTLVILLSVVPIGLLTPCPL